MPQRGLRARPRRSAPYPYLSDRHLIGVPLGRRHMVGPWMGPGQPRHCANETRNIGVTMYGSRILWACVRCSATYIDGRTGAVANPQDELDGTRAERD